MLQEIAGHVGVIHVPPVSISNLSLSLCLSLSLAFTCALLCRWLLTRSMHSVTNTVTNGYQEPRYWGLCEYCVLLKSCTFPWLFVHVLLVLQCVVCDGSDETYGSTLVCLCVCVCVCVCVWARARARVYLDASLPDGHQAM